MFKKEWERGFAAKVYWEKMTHRCIAAHR